MEVLGRSVYDVRFGRAEVLNLVGNDHSRMISVPQFFPMVGVSVIGEAGSGEGQTAWQL